MIPSRLIAIECLLFWIAFAVETVGCCNRWYAILLAEIVRALVASNVSLGDHGLANISLSVGQPNERGTGVLYNLYSGESPQTRNATFRRNGSVQFHISNLAHLDR